MEPSSEQLNILKSLINSHVVVDSVAGCGKTTTIKYTAMAFRKEMILVLMYNFIQRKNTKEEMLALGIKNVDIHTFHSCGFKYYDSTCSRDSGIRDAIDNNKRAEEPPNRYSIIIIDEVQDMNKLYYAFSQKLIKDLCKKNVRIMILGDYMQGINTFNGSEISYILNPEEYFSGTWTKCSLNTTFRLTPEMVDFVNAVNDSFGTGYRKLVSPKPKSMKPKYYICDMTFVHTKVKEYLATRSPHEILVLAPSVRKDKRVTDLCNLLSKENVPLYLAGDSEYRSESAAGKLVVSTIHAIKGDERPIVMLIGFDDSVFPKMLTGGLNTNSVIYVALTRAKDELIIFHNYANAYIVPKSIINEYCDFEMVRVCKKDYVNRKCKDDDRQKSVTDMVKYLSNEIKVECMKSISVTQLQAPEENLSALHNIPTSVPSTVDGSMEYIADINGFLVPAFHSRFSFDFSKLKRYFSEVYRGTPLMSLVNKYIAELSDFSDDFLMDPYCDLHQLLRSATIYNGLHNRLFYKIEQIKDYDWITYEFLNECSTRIDSQVSAKSQFEVVAERGPITGIIDVLDGDTVYELKCTSMIEEEHILQLALYSYLIPGKKYRLFNIFTNELLEIRCDAARVAEVLLRK